MKDGVIAWGDKNEKSEERGIGIGIGGCVRCV